jgi:DNA-binding MarR family transcriptional regulator
MLDKMSDTSRIVDRLVLKQLVQKVVCESDRRLVDVTITEAGLMMLDQLDQHQEEMDAIFHNLTEAEAIQLNALLDKIRSSD